MNRYPVMAQLVRLPNLPSALADICLGAVVVGALPGHWLPFLLLLMASGCLYCSGMVWNDYFDHDQDKRERPFRPIPSGKVTLAEARLIGITLMATGFVLALLAGWSQPLVGGKASSTAAIVAGLIIASIFLYDKILKPTSLGALAMGLCRLLNVVLGVSVSGGLYWIGHEVEATDGSWLPSLQLALVVGIYVTGVTWFARNEAGHNNPTMLMLGAIAVGTSFVLALTLPIPLGLSDPRRAADSSPLFPYLLVLLSFAVGIPGYHAIRTPTARNVQFAVGRSLFCLIILDAILASALAGTGGLAILLLLIPGAYLHRQKALYAT